MENIGLNERIDALKAYAKKKNITYDQIASLSNIPISTIKKIFCGITKTPRIDTVQAIERALGLAPSPLAGNVYEVGGLLIFEEIGTVKAGYHGSIDEIPTGRKIEIPASMISGNQNEYFVLRVKGNSMYPRLLEGDTILCRRCDSVDSGSLAVVLYDGDEATVKKVNYVQGEGWLELIPFNPEYPTKRIEGADLELCRILGLVVKLIRDL